MEGRGGLRVNGCEAQLGHTKLYRCRNGRKQSLHISDPVNPHASHNGAFTDASSLCGFPPSASCMRTERRGAGGLAGAPG